MKNFMLAIVFCCLSVSAYSNEDLLSAENVPELLQFQGDGETFMLKQPLNYRIDRTKELIVVPAGFVTDYASVPGWARSIVPKLGTHSVAAVVHDFLYWNQACTRLQADNILYDAMIEYKTSWIKRNLVYYAVRAAGFFSWRGNKRDQEKGLARVLPKEFRDIPPNAIWEKFRAGLPKQPSSKLKKARVRAVPEFCKL